ncbi:MAG TPA: hypothetical protein VJ901_13770 [Thermoanaerobaculia bacterium]|nr:hypothetical protein [Thermoanaerobaculia bacterium]
MMNETLTPFSMEGLSIVPAVHDTKMRLTVSGAVEMRDPGELLNPFWTRIDQEARDRHLQAVEVDLRDLTFMNSSGILTLVRWITKLKVSNAYRLVFQYDRNVTWQRSSIPTLAKLAPNVVVPQEING